MQQRWTATTVKEALDLLEAAERLIDSRVLALTAGSDASDRAKAKRQAPALLTIHLDLTELEENVVSKHAFDEIVRHGRKTGLATGDATDLH